MTFFASRSISAVSAAVIGATSPAGAAPVGACAPPAVPNPPEGAPTPQDLQTHEMLVTVSLGWKITY